MNAQTEAMVATMPPATQRRINRLEVFITWLVPRLAGTTDEKDTTLALVMEHLSESFNEGIEEAGYLVTMMLESDQVHPERRNTLRIVQTAIVKLAAENRRNRKEVSDGRQGQI